VRLRWVEPLQHGQEERAGLTAAGAGLNHHLPPGEQVRDRARLDGQELRPGHASGSRAQALGQLFEGYIR